MSNTHLKELNIHHNDIGFGGKEFLKKLKLNKTLQFLKCNFSLNFTEQVSKILRRNQFAPWFNALNNARFIAQAQRCDNCLLGTVPVEIAAHINNYAVGANHTSFFLSRVDKRPSFEDVKAAVNSASQRPLKM